MPATIRNRLLIKGRLRRNVRQFIKYGQSLLAYNGSHPDFPVDLFPGIQRATLTQINQQLDGLLDKNLFPD